MREADQRVRAFVRALASRQPTPGGGSAAAVAGALGAALYVKVGRIVLARSRPPASRVERRRLQRVCVICARESAALVLLVETDAKAYGTLVAAWRQRPHLQRGRVSAKRWRQVQQAALRAPLQICERAATALAQGPVLMQAAGSSLVSDVTAGSALLVGSFAAAAATVAANLDGLGQRARAEAVRRRLAALLRSIPSHMARQ